MYEVVPDYVERRGPLRAEHLALARAAATREELVLGGALADPVDGAILVFRGDSPAAAEAFAAADPYVRNGLVTAWRVRAWSVVVGAPRLIAPAAGPGEPAFDAPVADGPRYTDRGDHRRGEG